MKRHFAILASIMIFAAINVYCQGGSNYSIYGIGDINKTLGAVYEGVGGTSIAFPSESGINTLNPALWGKVTMTRLQGGYKFNQNFISDNNNSLMQNNGKVNGILGLFSIDTSIDAAISFGVYPYSNVNYLISTPEKVSVQGTTVDGFSLYQGEGGISQAYVGGSINLIDDLTMGAAVFTSFGYVQSTIKTAINDQYGNASGVEKKDNFTGWGLKAGLYYTPVKSFSIGAFIENHMSLNATIKERLVTESLKSDTSITSTGSFILPASYGFGLSYFSGKFLFGADLQMQDFSGYSYRLGQMKRADYRNTMSVSLGLSRLGTKSYTNNFFDKVFYNFGLGYRQLYYTVTDQGGNKHGIDEFYGSFGMELPVMGAAQLNTALTFGSRGTKDAGLINEKFVRFSVDISLGEEWFKPFRGTR